MKRIIIILILAALFCVSAQAVNVSDVVEQSLQVESIRDGLDAETKEQLESYSPASFFDFSEAIQKVIRNSIQSIVSPLSQMRNTFCVLVACAFLYSLTAVGGNPSQNQICLTACCFASSGVFLQDLVSSSQGLEEFIDRIESLSLLLLPVLCSAAASSGNLIASGALYSGAVFFISILIRLARKLLLPLVYCKFALCIGLCLSDNDRLQGFLALVNRIFSIALKGLMYIFTAYISITGILSSGYDAASNQAAKAILSTALPPVGSILSESSEAVMASAGVLKQTVGAFGLLAILVMALAPFFRLAIYSVLLLLASALANLLSGEPIGKLLHGFSVCTTDLLGIVGSLTVMMLISVCCFLKVVSGI